MQDKIYVTRPLLPPIEEFIPLIEEIWANQWLTNHGPLYLRFEEALKDFLDVEHIALVSSGTMGLSSAMNALKIKGQVITTPYSFVATSNAILLNNAEPVFVDIDRESLNIDVTQIETAITPQTTAIMPVHCFGRACDTNVIEAIAKKHNISVIYDAAHTFGVRDNGKSLLDHGDASVVSFHATKVFNTFEGGAVVCRTREIKERIDCLNNFGLFEGHYLDGIGVNGKMSEINAAMGLVQLKYIDQAIGLREKIHQFYYDALSKVEGLRLIDNCVNGQANYSYFPILIKDNYKCSIEELIKLFEQKNIYTKRYFYPLISSFSQYKKYTNVGQLPVANDVSNRSLCLPLYPSLTLGEAQEIVSILTG